MLWRAHGSLGWSAWKTTGGAFGFVIAVAGVEGLDRKAEARDNTERGGNVYLALKRFETNEVNSPRWVDCCTAT